MKRIIQSIVVFCMLTVLLAACAERIVEQTDVYRITEARPQEYRYTVFSASGKRIDCGEASRTAPQFIRIDADVLKMTLGYGTNVYDCVYYRLSDGCRSNAFPNAIAECGGYVLYVDDEDGLPVLKAEKPFERAKALRCVLSDLNPSLTFDEVLTDDRTQEITLRYVNRNGADRTVTLTLF